MSSSNKMGSRGGKSWYKSPQVPLLPIFNYVDADQHNAPNFSFSWLFLSVWSLSAAEFEIAIVANTHFGVVFTAILPYLRVVLAIPLHERFSIWYFRVTNREKDYTNN